MENKIKLTFTDDDGNEIHLPTPSDEEMKEITKRIDELHKNLFRGFKTWVENSRNIVEKIYEVFKNGKTLTEKDFDEKFPAVKAYMEKQGLMLPTNSEEFFRWFILVKHRYSRIDKMAESWPEIQPGDFNEFNIYKAGLFQKGGDFVTFPSSFQSIISDAPDKELLDILPKKAKQKSSLPQTLESCFNKSNGGFKRVLKDATKVGLIMPDDTAPNGYKWIYKGEDEYGNKLNRGHGIRALWHEANSNGFIIERPGNEKHIKGLLMDFFGFDSLTHGVLTYTYTVKNESEYNKLRESLRIQLVKKQ